MPTKQAETAIAPSTTSDKLAKPKNCTPFSVTVAILTPDDKTEINFGLTKGCNPDNTAFWIIDFMLKQKNAAGVMVTRIEVHVHIGKELQATAESLAQTKQLTPEGLALLQTKVAKRAKQLPTGTSNDEKLNNLLIATIDN